MRFIAVVLLAFGLAACQQDYGKYVDGEIGDDHPIRGGGDGGNEILDEVDRHANGG